VLVVYFFQRYTLSYGLPASLDIDQVFRSVETIHFVGIKREDFVLSEHCLGPRCLVETETSTLREKLGRMAGAGDALRAMQRVQGAQRQLNRSGEEESEFDDRRLGEECHRDEGVDILKGNLGGAKVARNGTCDT
jgi:hypothetical protein